MNRMLTRFARHRKLLWIVLLALVLMVLAIVLIPVFLIMPFRPQTPRGVEISYLMRRYSAWFTLVSLALIVMLLFTLWSRARWWGRALLVIVLLPVLGATWLARQNHFEWMFNPLPLPQYARATEATFIGDDDRVLAVEIGGEAVAYPIRLMAYHHVVQDTVGGTHIIATY